MKLGVSTNPTQRAPLPPPHPKKREEGKHLRHAACGFVGYSSLLHVCPNLEQAHAHFRNTSELRSQLEGKGHQIHLLLLYTIYMCVFPCLLQHPNHPNKKKQYPVAYPALAVAYPAGVRRPSCSEPVPSRDTRCGPKDQGLGHIATEADGPCRLRCKEIRAEMADVFLATHLQSVV